jgi:uncharacterized protein DUF6084
MSAVSHTPAFVRDSAPELRFAVSGAEPAEYSATPTLMFGLEIEAPGGQAIRSLLLDVQIQIAARRRGYSRQAQERLLELFGTPERWSSTLRTLPWLRSTVVVPPFTGAKLVELTVACTYDLEVTASRYLAALEGGEIPLEFLLSGSVFYGAPDGRLQMARIPWDHEVAFGMPIDVWRRTMDMHFPASAWLRIGRERYDALCAYKARHAFESWDATIDALLHAGSEAP